jgi:hypothetical protein
MEFTNKAKPITEKAKCNSMMKLPLYEMQGRRGIEAAYNEEKED